jgi:SAM-dependent methyltransferase
MDADPILTSALEPLQPTFPNERRALDLACGKGRHAQWLANHGWKVTAVDVEIEPMPGIEFIRADLEKHEYRIPAGGFDLIICWLYWQRDLLDEIARGVRPGGVAALAGKTSGRFATSLESYRSAFEGWREIASGEDQFRCFLIARKEALD